MSAETREIIETAARQGALAVLFANDKPGGLLLCGVSNFLGKSASVPAFSITYEEGEWLRRLLETALSAAKGAPALHTLCLLPRGEYRGAATDDWDVFAGIEGIDRLATDPYWMDRPVRAAEFVRGHATPLKELCLKTGRELEVWIQGIRIPAGEENKIAEAVAAAEEVGADSIAFWSFRGTERMSWLACGDPDTAWEVMKDSVRTFSSA